MNAVDHNNVVIFDDRGIPSIMCRFVRPKDGENKRPCREVKRYFRYSGIGYLRILRSQEDEARQQLYSGNRSYRKSKYQMA